MPGLAVCVSYQIHFQRIVCGKNTFLAVLDFSLGDSTELTIDPPLIIIIIIIIIMTEVCLKELSMISK